VTGNPWNGNEEDYYGPEWGEQEFMTTTAVRFGAIYLGNKMTGIPYFNAKWFDATAAQLRVTPGVESVFNPAEFDRARGFEPLLCPTGSAEEAKAAGFNAREALGADWAWIAEHSDGLVIGPDWAKSPGTISEIACHQALKLPVWEAGTFFCTAMYDAEALFYPEYQFPPLGVYLV
jgi:hypothetical protein